MDYFFHKIEGIKIKTRVVSFQMNDRKLNFERKNYFRISLYPPSKVQ